MIDQVEEMIIIFNPDGTVVFPWWSPLVEETILNMGLRKLDEESSIFCG